jgi:hypothetical protein
MDARESGGSDGLTAAADEAEIVDGFRAGENIDYRPS